MSGGSHDGQRREQHDEQQREQRVPADVGEAGQPADPGPPGEQVLAERPARARSARHDACAKIDRDGQA